jgi:ACS family tartrate transporter-like MFS transporter
MAASAAPSVHAPDPDRSVRAAALAKASWRLLPLLALGYLVAYMDRVNVSFAALQMNADLGFSATIYGLGGGLFFLAYALFEIPSNMIMPRFGPRRWLARIMITWGLIAAAMMFVRQPWHFYVLRFLLGVAEAGFFPCVVYYLAHWFPRACRGRATSAFYMSGALASVVMGATSASLLALDGIGGMRGWEWLFLAQGLPAVVVGAAILFFLPDEPATARWLKEPERAALVEALARERDGMGGHDLTAFRAIIADPLVQWLAAIGFLSIGTIITFNLSAPLLLRADAGLDASGAGMIVMFGGMLGVASMLASGFLSDWIGDRFLVMFLGLGLMAVAFAMIAFAPAPAVTLAGTLLFYLVYPMATVAQATLWGDVFHVRRLAIASAAINTVSQIGAFIGPYAWGRATDATGSYQYGLIGLSLTCTIGLMLGILLYRRIRADRVASLRVATTPA